MKRGDFLKNTALALAGITIVPRHVLGGNNFLAPSDRINLGYIGVGKQVGTLMNGLAKLPETMIIAASDVDQRKLTRFISSANQVNAKKSNKNVEGYADYRELLQRKDIDAIVVASPDHWHALHVIDAAKAGKDIYCEKPLALTIDEGRAMCNAVKKYKRVLQTGSMQRSQYNFRQAVDLIRNGYIGEVHTVNVHIGEPVKQCDLPNMAVPDYLDWDMWVGPSLYRGYHSDLSPPIESTQWAGWRWYRDFGGGNIADWGAHMFDIIQWALEKDHTGPNAFVPPDKPGAKFGLYYTYENGPTIYHKNWGESNAIQFIGTEGKIEVSRSFLRFDNPKLENIQFKSSDKRVHFSDNHYADWVKSMKERSNPVASVEVGHRTSTVCNAANIAYELQKPLKWDPKKESFDNGFANNMRSRPYRGSWDYTKF
ncbi:Gfo/Idh/MocA family protein [Sphingobacterium bovistauri]|uniref:Gfo/Idh/MocA family oxidoreductase n=1 Tax=Sphingobacterium bovistauri TaxID=2781959 RepID=A0ABS7Z2A2_9SPHI|nr:Gfo/Idh/MocA family oxidoreductase [Sphingobacterium bovistauri]MCA5003722.1 Gfo/Idh/MocA family oxidoreductase [Sphingobacterium bovistauri]